MHPIEVLGNVLLFTLVFAMSAIGHTLYEGAIENKRLFYWDLLSISSASLLGFVTGIAHRNHVIGGD
jgi:hypothetical protein